MLRLGFKIAFIKQAVLLQIALYGTSTQPHLAWPHTCASEEVNLGGGGKKCGNSK